MYKHTKEWIICAEFALLFSLAGLKVSLSGLETIKSTDASSQIYSVLSSHSSPADLQVLTSRGQKQTASPCASGFAGILSISEGYEDCNRNPSPVPVPAAPAPSFPPGLKQRFQPFGSSTAAHVFHSTTSKKVKLEYKETEVRRKKKKKKEKHSREETTEAAHNKQEETSYEISELQVPEPVEDDMPERKKKKKIKKEKERRDMQEEVAIAPNLTVKQEPMDTSFGDIESSVKKKKKKKKAKVDY